MQRGNVLVTALGLALLPLGPAQPVAEVVTASGWPSSRSSQDSWRRLTEHPAADFHPSWSPDGKRILFDSERDGHWEVYLAGADGTAAKRLTHGSTASDHPRWFPDDKRILFESEQWGAPELCSMLADGSSVVRLTQREGTDGAGFLSPDGTHNVSDRDGNLELYALAVAP